MAPPTFSVVIPVRNESKRIAATIRSILSTRVTNSELEVIVVDDASVDGCCDRLSYEASGTSVRVNRLDKRVGVPRARNQGVRIATGDLLFITDAHVRFCEGWDRHVLEYIEPNRIIAATVVGTASAFKGYGCSLVVPFMGTKWNREKPTGVAPVQVSTCVGTVLKRTLFESVGGYDPGMLVYGAAEPEFSIRCWLSGAEIVSVPDLEVGHRFKPKAERTRFIEDVRLYVVHNCLRFGLLYLDQVASLRMIGYFASAFPRHAKEAFDLLEMSDVWQRRDFLKSSLVHDFDWFDDQFDIVYQAEA